MQISNTVSLQKANDTITTNVVNRDTMRLSVSKKDSMTISQQAQQAVKLIPQYNSLTHIGGQPIQDLKKAVNNVLTIESGIPYRYMMPNGLFFYFNYLSPPSSAGFLTDDICNELKIGRKELFRNIFNQTSIKEMEKMSDFFSFINGHGVSSYCINLRYTGNEVLSHFKELGIEPGWVEVHCEGVANKFFLSNGGTVHSTKVIEQVRHSVNSRDWRLTAHDGTVVLKEGDIITCNGKDYVIDANGRINIPPGEPVIWGVTFAIPGAEDYYSYANRYEYK